MHHDPPPHSHTHQVYLRVSEAQRCRVHSTLFVPIFDKASPDVPLAVFELVQSEKEVVFPAIMTWLRQSLEASEGGREAHPSCEYLLCYLVNTSCAILAMM